MRCDAHPLLFTSPVTSALENTLDDDDEETDPALLGSPLNDDDDNEGD
jgi:hypothetical protein